VTGGRRWSGVLPRAPCAFLHPPTLIPRPPSRVLPPQNPAGAPHPPARRTAPCGRGSHLSALAGPVLSRPAAEHCPTKLLLPFLSALSASCCQAAGGLPSSPLESRPWWGPLPLRARRGAATRPPGFRRRPCHRVCARPAPFTSSCAPCRRSATNAKGRPQHTARRTPQQPSGPCPLGGAPWPSDERVVGKRCVR
jgi:hypothetical protein